MQRAFFLRIGLLILLLFAAATPPARAFDGCRAADVNDDGLISILDVFEILDAVGQPSPRLDLDGSGLVGEEDARIALDFFAKGCPSCPGDLDSNGDVNADDRALLEAAFGRDCRSDLTRDDLVGDNDIETAVIYFQSGPFPAPHSAEARGDVNGDGTLNINDILKVIDDVGVDCRADLNKDGEVDTTDVWFLLASLGMCP